MDQQMQPSRVPGRGFASMDPAKRKEIASLGGKAAHAQGKGHEFTPEEAKVAGRVGGQVVSQDKAHMAAIGRLGGLAGAATRKAKLMASPVIPPKAEGV